MLRCVTTHGLAIEDSRNVSCWMKDSSKEYLLHILIRPCSPWIGLGLKKIMKNFDLFGIEIHLIPSNLHVLRAKQTNPKEIHFILWFLLQILIKNKLYFMVCIRRLFSSTIVCFAGICPVIDSGVTSVALVFSPTFS